MSRWSCKNQFVCGSQDGEKFSADVHYVLITPAIFKILVWWSEICKYNVKTAKHGKSVRGRILCHSTVVADSAVSLGNSHNAICLFFCWIFLLEVRLSMFWAASRSFKVWRCLVLASSSRLWASSSRGFRAVQEKISRTGSFQTFYLDL